MKRCRYSARLNRGDVAIEVLCADDDALHSVAGRQIVKEMPMRFAFVSLDAS